MQVIMITSKCECAKDDISSLCSEQTSWNRCVGCWRYTYDKLRSLDAFIAIHSDVMSQLNKLEPQIASIKILETVTLCTSNVLRVLDSSCGKSTYSI